MPKPPIAHPQSPRIGIDLGGTKIEIIALAEDAEILYRHRVATPICQPDKDSNIQYQNIIQTIESLVSDCEKQLSLNTPAKRISSLGIGIPGAISPTSGLVKNANTTCLIGRSFQQDLQQALNCEITIANDADCFVLSEAISGVGKQAQSIFGVIIGTGCGGGLVINKQLVSGPNAICGEWGHNPLPWPQPSEELMPCYCGKQGCIETFLSGPGFVKHNSLHYPQITANQAKDWHQLLLAKQPEATEAFERYADQLAKSLASVINIIDPELIVLGGGMSNIDYLYQRVPELLPKYVFSDQVLTRLEKAEHGDSSGVIGAAYLG